MRNQVFKRGAELNYDSSYQGQYFVASTTPHVAQPLSCPKRENDLSINIILASITAITVLFTIVCTEIIITKSQG